MIQSKLKTRELAKHIRRSASKGVLLVSLVFVFVSLLVGIYSYTRGGESARVHAATASTINFQGRLFSSSGALVADGYYNLRFKLYYADSGGATLWTDTRTDTNGVTAGQDYRIRVKNGYFSVALGDTSNGGTALTGINFDQELWLTIDVGGTDQTTPSWDGEMTPRIKLTAVPYALEAGTAAGVTSNATNAASTNSDAVSITTGNAAGATSNSGSITIDVGTATQTAGTISVGTANTSGITIGRTGITTTNSGALTVTQALTASSTLQVDGNVTLGNANTDTVTINAATSGTGFRFVDATFASCTALETDASGDLTCGSDDAGSGGSLFTDGGTFTYLTATADDLVVGDSTVAGASLYVDESAGSTTFGNASLAGTLIVSDGSSNTVSVTASGVGSNYTLTLPASVGSANNCLKNTGTPGILEFDNCNNGSGAGGAVTLQDAYDDSSTPAEILLATGKNLLVSLPDVATDPNFLVNIATSSTSKFAVQYNSIDQFSVTGTAVNIGVAANPFTLTGSSASTFVIDGVTVDATEFNRLNNGIEAGDLTTQGSTTDEFCLTYESTSGALLEWQSCGGGSGDSVSVNGSGATDLNFINVSASATAAAVTWTLDTAPTPDTISLAIGAASGTDAGILTANAQTIGGAKTLTDTLLVKGASGNYFELQNSGSTTLARFDSNGFLLITPNTTSTSALKVENNTSDRDVFAVDTTNNKTIFGETAQSGSLEIWDGSANTVTLTATGVTGNYSLKLPTATGSTSECLKTDAADASQLVFGTCGSGLSGSLTDNIADAWDVQEGTNNYININTTNSSENISFGNATTNPSYDFLGSGTLTVGGRLVVNGNSLSGSWNGSILRVDGTATDTANPQAGNYVTLNVSPSGASTQEYSGLYNVAQSNSTNLSGSGAMLTGIMGNSNYYGTGTLSRANGVRASVWNQSSGTITDAYGVSIANPYKPSGNITNAYGLHIENQTSGTNNYGIWIQGASTYALWVDSGNTRLDGDLSVGTDLVSGRVAQFSGVVSIKGSDARLQLEPSGGGTNNLWNIDNSGGTLRVFRENYSATGTGGGGAIKLAITDGGNVGIDAGSPSYDLTFGEGYDRTIQIEVRNSNAAGRAMTLKAGNAGGGASAFAGGVMNVQGGNAAGTGNANGGDLVMAGGTAVGSGSVGSVIARSSSNTTAAFSVQNASSASIFNVDTTNSEVELGNGSAAGKLLIADGTSNYVTITASGVTSDYSLKLPTAVGSTSECLKTDASDANQLVFGSCGSGTSEITDGGTYLYPADSSGAEDIVIGGTSTAAADIWLQANGSAVFNEQGTTGVNFRVESDTNANMFFVDGTNNAVGIGTGSITANFTLDVTSGGQNTNVAFRADATGATSIYLDDAAAGVGSIIFNNTTNELELGANGGSLLLDYSGVTLGANQNLTVDTNALFVDGTNDKVSVGSTTNTSVGKFFVTGAAGGTNNVVAEFNGTTTGTGSAANLYATFDVSPGSSSTNEYGSLWGEAFLGNNNLGAGGTMAGVYGSGFSYGSGTVSGAVMGGHFKAGNSAAGTVAAVAGVGVNSNANTGGGTITANYGLYIADQTVGVSDYGLYIQDADTYAIFVDDGATRLDGTLEVNGNITFGNANTDTITVNSAVSGTGFRFTDATFASCSALETDASGDLTCGTDNTGGGGSSTKTVRLVPEYAGVVLSADGSSNSGTLTTDFVSGLSGADGEKHNYYQWTTSQSSAQDYTLVVNVPIPSDFSTIGAASTFKFWIYDGDGSSTTAKVNWEVRDEDETSCFASDFNASASNDWEQLSASTLGSCSFAADNTMTVIFKVFTSSSAGSLRIGEFEFQYST